MVTKKVIDELLKYELAKTYEIINVMESLDIIPISPKGYLSESDAWCWYEDNPSEEEKKRVLTALGYDVSKLQPVWGA